MLNLKPKDTVLLRNREIATTEVLGYLQDENALKIKSASLPWSFLVNSTTGEALPHQFQRVTAEFDVVGIVERDGVKLMDAFEPVEVMTTSEAVNSQAVLWQDSVASKIKRLIKGVQPVVYR